MDDQYFATKIENRLTDFCMHFVECSSLTPLNISVLAKHIYKIKYRINSVKRPGALHIKKGRGS